jgi:alcohol dehydrogenase class IV
MTASASIRPRFDFATANRILFGRGTIREIGPSAIAFGKRMLLVTGAPQPTTDEVSQRLKSSGGEVSVWPVLGEPTLPSILEAVRSAQEQKAEIVIGLGGGSAMDTAKAVAVLAVHPGDPTRYLEVVGQGQTLKHSGLVCIAIPTTAGTGAEATRNAVIGIPDRKIKVSLRSAFLLPKLALIDPDLTRSLPPGETAATGMDALTQVLEPFVCTRANALTDGFCRDGLRLAAQSLLAAYLDGDLLSAREDMSLASLYGGLALANAGLGAAHGFAAPLGGLLAAPHGALCARLLPEVMRTNIRALRARAPDSPALERYAEVARICTRQTQALPEEGAEWVRSTVEALHIPRLGHWGLTVSALDAISSQALQASSMKANPVSLTSEELIGILQSAL